MTVCFANCMVHLIINLAMYIVWKKRIALSQSRAITSYIILLYAIIIEMFRLLSKYIVPTA